jgi:hypothetical protein
MMVESLIVTGITLRHRTVGTGSAAGTTSEYCVPARLPSELPVHSDSFRLVNRGFVLKP